jgi:hypothetical protein
VSRCDFAAASSSVRGAVSSGSLASASWARVGNGDASGTISPLGSGYGSSKIIVCRILLLAELSLSLMV